MYTALNVSNKLPFHSFYHFRIGTCCCCSVTPTIATFLPFYLRWLCACCCECHFEINKRQKMRNFLHYMASANLHRATARTMAPPTERLRAHSIRVSRNDWSKRFPCAASRHAWDVDSVQCISIFNCVRFGVLWLMWNLNGRVGVFVGEYDFNFLQLLFMIQLNTTANGMRRTNHRFVAHLRMGTSLIYRDRMYSRRYATISGRFISFYFNDGCKLCCCKSFKSFPRFTKCIFLLKCFIVAISYILFRNLCYFAHSRLEENIYKIDEALSPSLTRPRSRSQLDCVYWQTLQCTSTSWITLNVL